MTFARRLAAASMALVLAVFPLAMERCRTACVTPAVETEQAAPGHACHEASSDAGSGTRMDPVARACGHSDDARFNEAAGLAPGKTRTFVPVPIVELDSSLHAAVDSARPVWASRRAGLSRALLPLNSPLRL